MTNEHLRTIEIEGHKFEIDTRTAKKIEQFRVGDRVKVLKKYYGDDYRTHPGVIVGIDNFKNLPTVVIAYLKEPLSNDVSMEFVYLNSQTKNVEICPMCEDDVMPTRETVIMHFDRTIDKLLKSIDTIREKKEFFLRSYGTAMVAEFTTATFESNEI